MVVLLIIMYLLGICTAIAGFMVMYHIEDAKYQRHYTEAKAKRETREQIEARKARELKERHAAHAETLQAIEFDVEEVSE